MKKEQRSCMKTFPKLCPTESFGRSYKHNDVYHTIENLILYGKLTVWLKMHKKVHLHVYAYMHDLYIHYISHIHTWILCTKKRLIFHPFLLVEVLSRIMLRSISFTNIQQSQKQMLVCVHSQMIIHLENACNLYLHHAY